jgi:hypothetical protein
MVMIQELRGESRLLESGDKKKRKLIEHVIEEQQGYVLWGDVAIS